MKKTSFLLANFVFLCCLSWISGKLINPEATLLDCTETSVSGYCADCLSQIVCSKDQSPTIISCPSGQVCQEVIGGFSTCLYPLDVPGCACPTTGVDVIADFYDDEKFIVCLDGAPYVQECEDGATVNKETNECEFPPTTTPKETTTTITPIERCPSGKYDVVAVTCTQYRYCLSNGVTSAIQNCNLGEIFNTNDNNCQFYYPFNCTEKTNGFYTDTQNCTVYHLCIDGEIYGLENNCPEGEYFDEVNQECGPQESVTCNILLDCGICPDSKTFIPIDSNSYYQCSDNNDEATKSILPYVPIYHTCPAGTYFNPTSSYCEFS